MELSQKAGHVVTCQKRTARWMGSGEKWREAFGSCYQWPLLCDFQHHATLLSWRFVVSVCEDVHWTQLCWLLLGQCISGVVMRHRGWQHMDCMAGWLGAEGDTARGLDRWHCGKRLVLPLVWFDCVCKSSRRNWLLFSCSLPWLSQLEFLWDMFSDKVHTFLYDYVVSQHPCGKYSNDKSGTQYWLMLHWLQFQVNKTQDNCIPDEHYIQTLLAVSLLSFTATSSLGTIYEICSCGRVSAKFCCF